MNWRRLRFSASVRSAREPAQQLQPMSLAVKGGGAVRGCVCSCGSNGSWVDRCAAFSSSSYSSYSSSFSTSSTAPKKSSPPDLRHCEQTSVSSAVATGHRRIHKIPSNGISFRFQRGNVMSNRIEKRGRMKKKKKKRNSSHCRSCQRGTKTKKGPWHRLNTLRDNGEAPAGCHLLEQSAAVPNATLQLLPGSFLEALCVRKGKTSPGGAK